MLKLTRTSFIAVAIFSLLSCESEEIEQTIIQNENTSFINDENPIEDEKFINVNLEKIQPLLISKGFIENDDEYIIKNGEILIDDIVLSKKYLENLIGINSSELKSSNTQYQLITTDYSRTQNITIRDFIPNSQSEWKQAFEEAVAFWNDPEHCLNFSILIVNNSFPSHSRIVIAEPDDFSKSNTIADARLSNDGGFGSRIRINYRNFPASSTSAEGRFNVLVHEIGHALGNRHTRYSQAPGNASHIAGTRSGDIGDRSSIMYSTSNSNTNTRYIINNKDKLTFRSVLGSTEINNQHFRLNSSRDRIIPFRNNNTTGITCYTPGSRRIKSYNVNNDGFEFINGSSNGLIGFDLATSGDQSFHFDYDGDGDDDICFYRPGKKIIYIGRRNSNGTYTNIISSRNGLAGFDLATSADRVIPFDYDGDGDDDLCFYRPGKKIIYIGRSNGNATFTNVLSSRSGLAGFDLATGSDKVIAFDYDADGDDDLCFYRPGKKIIYIGRSNGNATFTNVLSSRSGLAGFDLATGVDRVFAFDYDNDGDDDLGFYRPGQKRFWLGRSNGRGTFSTIFSSSIGVNSNYVGSCL